MVVRGTIIWLIVLYNLHDLENVGISYLWFWNCLTGGFHNDLLGWAPFAFNINHKTCQGIIDDFYMYNLWLCVNWITWFLLPWNSISLRILPLTFLYTCSAFNAACHIVKNYIAHLLNVKVPLILGMDSQFFFICQSFRETWTLVTVGT